MENVKFQNIYVEGYSNSFVLILDYSNEDSELLSTITIGEGVEFDTSSIVVDKSKLVGLILLNFTTSQIPDTDNEDRRLTIKNKISADIPHYYFEDGHQIYCRVYNYEAFDLYTYPSESFVGGVNPSDEGGCIEESSCLSISYIQTILDLSISHVTVNVVGNSFSISDGYTFYNTQFLIKGTSSVSSIIDVNDSSSSLQLYADFIISDLIFTFSNIPSNIFIEVFG